jgi:2'-5' RNA ligase
MSACPRYALYLAPDAASPLWRFGSSVLGYDAVTGQDVPHPQMEDFPCEKLHSITQEPRKYGFHATLKAPMRLQDGVDEAAFRSALADFAQKQTAFDLGLLTLACLGDVAKGKQFVSLVPAQASTALAALERATVTTLDAFRAPLSEAEIARRKPETLTPRQQAYLAQYGYPYVLEDYRPHFTLTGAVDEAHPVADSIALALAQKVGAARMVVDALCLFRQDGADARFTLIERFMFTPHP